ncbi:PP2C family protein-serine/threonine phosphatase [Thermodesulfobacteriota bacterium]
MQTEKQIHLQINTPQIIATGISDVGSLRTENEDSIWMEDSGLVLLVADGMGGHERGAEASQKAVEVFRKRLAPDTIKHELDDITAMIEVPSEISRLFPIVNRAVDQAATTVYERNLELELERYMGTTVVGLVLVEDDYVLWFHVGDSRLYRWKNSQLEQLTTDHSAHALWEQEGQIGKEPRKNIITRAIGPNPFVQAETNWAKREKDDMFILCSDGLSDMISDEEISKILKDESDVDKTAELLVSAAIEAGGKDNISVIVCRT